MCAVRGGGSYSPPLGYRGGVAGGIKRLVVLGKDGRHDVLRPSPVERTVTRVQVARIRGHVELHQREDPSTTVLRGREGRSLEPPRPGRVLIEPQASAVERAVVGMEVQFG